MRNETFCCRYRSHHATVFFVFQLKLPDAWWELPSVTMPSISCVAIAYAHCMPLSACNSKWDWISYKILSHKSLAMARWSNRNVHFACSQTRAIKHNLNEMFPLIYVPFTQQCHPFYSMFSFSLSLCVVTTRLCKCRRTTTTTRCFVIQNARAHRLSLSLFAAVAHIHSRAASLVSCCVFVVIICIFHLLFCVNSASNINTPRLPLPFVLQNVVKWIRRRRQKNKRVNTPIYK